MDEIETMDNKAVLRRYLECCNRHDFVALGAFVAIDVVVNNLPVGLLQYMANLERLVGAFPDYHWSLESLVGEGDVLAAHYTDTGTHLGTYLTFAPTGKRIRIQEFATYHLRAGMIAEVWTVADNLSTLLQISGLQRSFDATS